MYITHEVTVPSALVIHLYEAALDAGQWTGLCGEIATAFDSSGAALVVQQAGAAGLVLDCTAHTGDDLVDDYEQLYRWHEARAQKVQEPGSAAVYASGDPIAGAVACRPVDSFYVVGAVTSYVPAASGLLGMHRSLAWGNYDGRERKRVLAFLPFVERALRLRSRVLQAEMAEHCTLASLEAVLAAVFLIDVELRVLFANVRAAALFGADMPLRLHGGRLQTDSSDAQALARVVREVAGMGKAGAHALALRRGGRLPLTLMVMPFQPAGRAPSGLPSAIVLARDPEEMMVSSHALSQLFDLTPAEAGVAQALSTGAALEDIAALHRTSVNTVKTHLHHIYAKTATRRQGELIAMIHQSSATLTGQPCGRSQVFWRRHPIG